MHGTAYGAARAALVLRLSGWHIETPVVIAIVVSFFLFIIFVVYTMLPFNMRDAIIASVLTSSSHTIVLSVCLSASPGAKEHLVWQALRTPTPVCSSQLATGKLASEGKLRVSTPSC
ncbi:Adenylate cyclase type 2 [Tupaia chinensis]|uniref:Adenylate cyclase type 2 n=1 Tax=Tupaia chinensis TaxID=246437 RepID=L9L5C5_TUPCH|nr:Adenylate cyclase type 2 [Tupaia chinensis]